MVGTTGIMFVDARLIKYMLGMLNSSSFDLLYKTINTGVNATGGEISNTPAAFDLGYKAVVDQLVEDCIDVARITMRSKFRSISSAAHFVRR